MRLFLLLLLYLTSAFKVYSQSDVTFIKGGYISQGGPKGFQLGINITQDSHYFTRGFSFETSGLFQDGKVFISPRAGYEWQLAIIAAATEVSYYRENLYFVPQAGLTFFSNFDMLFGYNIRILGKNNQKKLNGLFFSTTININLSKRGFQKIWG